MGVGVRARACPTAQRPEGLEVDACIVGRYGAAEIVAWAGFLWVRTGVTVRSSGPGARLVGRPGWAAGHPFAAVGGMMGCAVLAGGVNQRGRPRLLRGS